MSEYTEIINDPRWLNVAVTPEGVNGHVMCVISSVLVKPHHKLFRRARAFLDGKCWAPLPLTWGEADPDWMGGAFVVALWAVYRECPEDEGEHVCALQQRELPPWGDEVTCFDR